MVKIENIECPQCQEKRIKKDGAEVNNIQRYRCRHCGKRFNENRRKNILTAKERLANELIKHLFKINLKDFQKAKAERLSINTKKLVHDVSENISKEKIPNEQLKFIHIRKQISNDIVKVPTPRTVQEYHIKSDSENYENIELESAEFSSKEYLMGKHFEEFAILLKNKNTIYLTNAISDVKCKELIIETREYRVTIEKKTDKYRNVNFYSKYSNARKDQKENLGLNKDKI